MGEVIIESELVQTVNDGKDGERNLTPAVLTRVVNPLILLIQHLEHLYQSNSLTWHASSDSGPSLPRDEIWVKFGGDKGGGSLKFCMQVVNRKNPNSADHTVVLSLLEADDSLSNMHLVMDPSKNLLEELPGMKWR